MPSYLMPDTLMIVTKIMTIVRQSENARTTFWVHLIWIFQIILMGMYKTEMYGLVDFFFSLLLRDRALTQQVGQQV